MRRLAAWWLALFAVYVATLGIPAFAASDHGGDEPHYLLTAASIAGDGDVDLANQYAARTYRAFYPYPLDPHGRLTGGRRHEPHGVGFPLLIAPAYALGGATLVEIQMAALAALAFVLAMALARRLVPEPWATAGPLVVALSPPALAYSTAVYPELTAGAFLAGAALLALHVRERPRMVTALGAGLLLGVLPWLGTKYALPGAVVAFAVLRWLWRRGRRTAGILAAEAMLMSGVVYVTVNDRLFGGITPYAADLPGQSATDASFPGGYLDRAHRLVGLWLDREYGMLRWAPFLALAGFAVWLLWRSRRDRVARALAGQRDVEAAAMLLAGVLGAQVVVAAFLSPTMFGFWFPGRHLVAALPAAGALAAWGLRRTPRAGAVLGALTLVASGWLYLELRLGDGGWVAPSSTAPWGPVEWLLPLFGVGSAWADVVMALAVTGVAALLVLEWRQWRQTAAMSREAYSA